MRNTQFKYFRPKKLIARLIVLFCCFQKLTQETNTKGQWALQQEQMTYYNLFGLCRWWRLFPVRREYIISVRQQRVKVYYLKMIARVVFGIFTLLALFQAGVTNFHTNKSSSACNCQPVIKVSVDGNTDSCNKQLLQEVNDLKKQLTTITEQLRQIIQPGKKRVERANLHWKQLLALRILFMYLIHILIWGTKPRENDASKQQNT